MDLHRLVMLPNGTVHEQHWVEVPPAGHPDVGPIARLFTGLRCDAAVGLPQGRLRIVWSGSPRGGAVGSFYLDDGLFLWVVLASGRNAEEDQVYLSTVGRQWDGSDMVRGLLGSAPSPFRTLHEITDRPLLVAVLIPQVPPEVYTAINGIEVATVAAYLAALDAEPLAGGAPGRG